MTGIKIEGEDELERATRKLQNLRGMRSAFTQSVNRSAQKARTFASRRVREQVNLKAQRVNKDIRLQRATRRQTTAWIRVSTRPVQLYRYGAKQRRKGVSVKVSRDGGRKLLRSAWIGTLPNGVSAVMRRKGKSRYPVDVLHGPSVFQVWRNDAREATYRVAYSELRTELRRQIRRRIERR